MGTENEKSDSAEGKGASEAIEPDKSKTSTREPKISGSGDIKLTIKDVLDSFNAIDNLANRALTGKATFRVSTAYGKVRKIYEKFQKGVNDIIKANGGEPGPNGYQLNPKKTDGKTNENYKAALETLDAHIETTHEEEIILKDIRMIPLQMLLDSLPAKVLKGKSDNPSPDDVVEDESRIEPRIISDLWWLIEEPDDVD